MDASAIFIDGTHIKANANRKKAIEQEVAVQIKNYQKQLTEEINADRETRGKKPLKVKDDDENPPTKTIKQSTTGPDCGLFRRGEHKVEFAYVAQVSCDRHNFILGCDIAPGNVNDSVMFDDLYASNLDERIDRRSFARQGVTDQIPTIHLGQVAHHLEALKPKKQTKYREENGEKLSKFKSAKSYLDGVLNGRTSVPTKMWKDEYAEKTTERKRLGGEYKTLKADVDKVTKIRSNVAAILKSEQGKVVVNAVDSIDKVPQVLPLFF